MVWASSAQLPSCHWGSLRFLLLCRYVCKEGYAKCCCNWQKGSQNPPGHMQQLWERSWQLHCVIVNMSHESRISLLRFPFCHIPFQQINGALPAVHPKESTGFLGAEQSFFFSISVGINPYLHQSLLDMKRVGSCPSVYDPRMMRGILGRWIIKNIKTDLNSQKSKERQLVTSDAKTVLGHRFLEASRHLETVDILGNQQFQ